MKYVQPLCTLLFGVAVLLFFGLAYPHHLHYQEQFQLFLFDSTYMWEVVKLPGGLADLLGRFCTQFFLFAWVGALIIALLLSVVQLLTLGGLRSKGGGQRSKVKGQWCYGLSFVPSFLLWLFLLDENALLGGVWAVLLTLLASWLFDQLPRGWVRRILLIVAVPVLYWVAGPVCIIFFLLQVSRLPMALLMAVMVFILSFFLPVPSRSLWLGIHYYRYPTEIPVMLWAATLSVLVYRLLAPRSSLLAQRSTLHAPLSSLHSPLSTLLSVVLVAVVMGGFVWKNSNLKAERVMHYDFMARHQQWNRIIETINAEPPNNAIGCTVQNLALGMHGALVYQLLDYNQNGTLGLLPDVQSDAFSPLPTAEVFYQLGMVYTTQRTVFEAQESILDFQKSARCYKRLAQTNLIIGSYAVSRKYLTALQKTLFYRDWANETLTLLGNEEAISKHPEYGRLRKFAYHDNFFFSDHVTVEMLQSLFLSNTENRLAYEYLIAYCLLTGDRENFAKYAEWGKKLGYPTVPRRIQTSMQQ